MMSTASKKYQDSDTSSVYSMATSTTYSMMSSSVANSHRKSYAPGMGGGITNDRVKKDLERYEKHLAKKFRKEVEK